MQQVGQNPILQADAAPLRVVYTRLDHLEKEITALNAICCRPKDKGCAPRWSGEGQRCQRGGLC
jgi:hypothetical protein